MPIWDNEVVFSSATDVRFIAFVSDENNEAWKKKKKSKNSSILLIGHSCWMLEPQWQDQYDQKHNHSSSARRHRPQYILVAQLTFLIKVAKLIQCDQI